jgi:hypothetical protein
MKGFGMTSRHSGYLVVLLSLGFLDACSIADKDGTAKVLATFPE